MVMGTKKVFVVSSALDEQPEAVLTLRMPEVISTPMQIGMVKTGEEIAARGDALVQELSMQDALSELRAACADDNPHERLRQVGIMAQKHSVGRRDMQLLLRWSDMADALNYYSRADVQEAMHSYTQGRCVRLEGTEEYLMLNQPSDISALASYMVGGGAAPVFRCTNARYYSEDDNMTGCNMVIQIDQPDVGNLIPIVSLLGISDIPYFALYNGDKPLRLVIPLEVLEIKDDGVRVLRWELSKLPDLASAFNRWLHKKLEALDGVRVSFYESFIPIPYSIADDGKRVNLPVRLEDALNLSPEMADMSAVGEIEDIKSFMPPNAEQKAAEFFAEVIL
jgi:hypothetical protein